MVEGDGPRARATEVSTRRRRGQETEEKEEEGDDDAPRERR